MVMMLRRSYRDLAIIMIIIKGLEDYLNLFSLQVETKSFASKN